MDKWTKICNKIRMYLQLNAKIFTFQTNKNILTQDSIDIKIEHIFE